MAAATAPVAALIPFFRDWKRTMTDIDAKIEDAQMRRAALVAERDPHIMAYVAGDDAAKKSTDRLDRSIEDVDRELTRLHIARSSAAENVARDAASEAAAKRETDAKELRAAVQRFQDVAGATDRAASVLAVHLATLLEASREVATRAGGNEISSLVADFQFNVAGLISHALHASKCPNFGKLPFGGGGRDTLASRVPDADYVVRVFLQQNGG